MQVMFQWQMQPLVSAQAPEASWASPPKGSKTGDALLLLPGGCKLRTHSAHPEQASKAFRDTLDCASSDDEQLEPRIFHVRRRSRKQQHRSLYRVHLQPASSGKQALLLLHTSHALSPDPSWHHCSGQSCLQWHKSPRRMAAKATWSCSTLHW